MSTTRPSMNTVRNHFNLGRARFATIARQPQFRGLLAPGDPPARMQAILTRLYELRNQPNARRQYRRELIDSSRAQSRARTEAAAQARAQEQADGRVGRRAARLRRQILANRRDAALRTFQQGVRRRLNGPLETFDVHDPEPEQAILPILKQYAGQYIRIVAFRDGEVVGDDEMLADHAYDVPTSNEAINRMFRNTIYWNWEVDSEEALLKSGDSIGVYRASVVTAAPGMVQFFAEGVAHCLFQPILEWCEGKLAEASNKQTRWRYGTIKKKVVEYMDKYQDGCPESVVYQIADELQLDIVIDMPFAEESTFINAKSRLVSSFSFTST